MSNPKQNIEQKVLKVLKVLKVNRLFSFIGFWNCVKALNASLYLLENKRSWLIGRGAGGGTSFETSPPAYQ